MGPRRARPTMADVAAEAGVSKMTVSRVLNGKEGVAEETAARVLRAVDALSYVRSHRGRSLAVGQSQVLGMIVLDISSEWIWPLVRGAGQQAEELGYQILLRTTGAGDVASFDARQSPFGSDLLDGLIVVSWRVPLAFSRELARRHYPVVLVDAYQRPTSVSWVGCKDRQGARQAVNHLVSLGHRQIGFISGGRRPFLATERADGFKEGMTAAGLPIETDLLVHGDFTRRSGYRAARQLLEGEDRPTAIFASNDLMAIGALNAARELGFTVPDELSVVGFDDIASAAHSQPPLTTVARPYIEMGASAVRQLIETISTPPEERKAAQMDLPTELTFRSSTAAPRTA